MNKKEKPKRGLVAITENDMKRKYPGSGLASDISVISQDTLWLPSRSIYLNYTMGGGIQYGKICEIFGGESSGKSLVALDFGYSAQFLGGVVLWNDAEQSFDPLWAQTNGLDLTRTHVYNETSIERISDWAADMAVTMRSKLVNNEPILIVTDSIAALDCEDNINSSQTNGKAEMGNRAKAIYRFLRTRNQLFSELGVVYIFINQLRKKVGATLFEDPDTTPGGDAMKFFASQRLAFFRKKGIYEEVNGYKVWVGNEASVRMKKNKLAPPRPSFTTNIYFNADYGRVGFGRYDNMVELMERTGVVTRKKGGSKYLLNGDTLATGADNFQEMLESNKELRSKLLRKANINTISRLQLKLERLKAKGENRYKVKAKKSRSSKIDDTE